METLSAVLLIGLVVLTLLVVRYERRVKKLKEEFIIADKQNASLLAKAIATKIAVDKAYDKHMHKGYTVPGMKIIRKVVEDNL